MSKTASSWPLRTLKRSLHNSAHTETVPLRLLVVLSILKPSDRKPFVFSPQRSISYDRPPGPAVIWHQIMVIHPISQYRHRHACLRTRTAVGARVPGNLGEIERLGTACLNTSSCICRYICRYTRLYTYLHTCAHAHALTHTHGCWCAGAWIVGEIERLDRVVEDKHVPHPPPQ